tara:strand:+ start:222 stop:827 length:606 start_codon:yes stop_codon:yes gene_type:complete
MIEYPFAIPFLSGILEEDDLVELRKDTRYNKSATQGYMQGGVKAQNPCMFNILDSYPKLRDKLLLNFNNFSYDIYGELYGWKIGTSWLTLTGQGDYIHEHTHPNYQWSGILYHGEEYTSSVPIIFINPLHKLFTYKLIPKESDVTQLTASWVVNPKPGLFVLFPSFIQHYTLKQESDEIRYSMAFNIMPTKVFAGDSSFEI